MDAQRLEATIRDPSLSDEAVFEAVKAYFLLIVVRTALAELDDPDDDNDCDGTCDGFCDDTYDDNND